MMMNAPRIIRPNAGFILPGSRFLDVGMPVASVGAVGRYKIIKHQKGVVLQETPWFDNLILDAGLNRWGTGTIILGCGIGTGTSTPANGQTGLDAESHWTTSSGNGNGVYSAAGASPYNNSKTFVYRTTLGALNGNYSEVAVGWAAGANKFSRALILDGGGNPTTIAVSSSEQLDIAYQLSVYPPLVDITNNITISGVSYTVTGRACNVNSSTPAGSGSWATSESAIGAASFNGFNNTFTGAIGAITSAPSGTGDAGGSTSSSAYSNNSLQRLGSATYGLNDANLSGGIRSTKFWWSVQAAFQYEFNPVIPKNNTKTLVLNYSVTWARRP